MDKIRARIEKKIALKSSSNIENDSAVSLAEQTKKNLLKMFDEYEDNESAVSDPVEIKKYNNKFQDLDYLNQAKMKVQQLTLDNDKLKMQLLQSSKNILAIREVLDNQRSIRKEEEQRIASKYKKENQETIASFQAKLQKNLKYIDELIEEKAKFNQQTQTFLLQRKKLQKTLSQQKQKYKIQMKSKIDALQTGEKQKRIKWEQAKIIELRQNTIKGMEPELNSIITRSRNEIKAVQQRCQKQKSEYRQQCYKEFQKKIIESKEEAFREHQIQKQKLRIEYSTKRKQECDKLEAQFSTDRQKIRHTYKSDIQDLEYKLRDKEQEFMKKRRQLYDGHLQEIMKIREDYEERIKILESSREKYLESEKQQLKIKYQNIANEEIQKIKREDKDKLKTAYSVLKQNFEAEKQAYIDQIAVTNSQFEKDIQIKYESKKKDQKKLYQDQIKKLRRDVGVLEEKLQKQNKTSGDVAKQKDHYQSKYMELKLQYDELIQDNKETKLKVKRLQEELDMLKINFKKELQLKLLSQKAEKQKQIEGLRKLIEKQQQDRALLRRSNEKDIRESQQKWADQMVELEKRARKALDKKVSEIQILKKDVKKHEQLAKGYEQMLQKQRQQLMASLYK